MRLMRWMAMGMFLASSVMVVTPVLAQSGPNGDARAEKRAERREARHKKMAEMRGKLVREKVGLSDAKAKKVEAILAKRDKEHFENGKKIHDTHRQLRELVESNSNDNAKYKALIADLRKTHEQMHSLRKKQIDELSAVLTPKEQAKMLVAMGEMKRRFHHRKGKYGGKHAKPGMCDGSSQNGKTRPQK